MMTGFQAEENLTGRAPKNVRKILDVIVYRIVLIEESHQKQSGRALFSPKTFKEFMTPVVIKTLLEIANEQQRVMAAGHHPFPS